MNFKSVGANIRKYRILKKMSQAYLAEKAEVSDNFIGMIERGDKNPSFETFIKIANTLEVSADVLLHDELVAGYEIKNSLLNERLEKVSREDRAMIYEVIDTMLKHMKQTKF